jgi:hypothetical protein
MLKYGNILNVNLGISKTLNPRNLTYQSNGNTVTVTGLTTTTSSTNQSTANFNSATITDLAINTLSLISNTLATSIVINSPVAFSVLKSDYETNNFALYPIFFSEDIYIKNKNFIINSENVTIQDNVIMINSQGTNKSINLNQTDNIISGFMFPIADINVSTGYYAGLLYVPNNKIQLINPNSTFYNWINDQFNYFTNKNKGFFKLKYIPEALNFAKYNNIMDNTYLDLINNNENLANLQLNAIALNDGEIVSMNNTKLSLKLSDGITLFETINLTKTDMNILNNLAIRFVNSLLIKDINNNNYISIDGTNSLINMYVNIFLNNPQLQIQFTNILNFYSNSNTMMTFTGSTNTLEIFATTLITNLAVIGSFQLNNIPLVFRDSLSIVGNNNQTYQLFDAINNRITFIVPTYINSLYVTTAATFNPKALINFQNMLTFQDSNSNPYIIFDQTKNQLTIPISTNANFLSINTTFQLLNQVPLLVSDKLTIQNPTSLFAIFDINNATFYKNIYINTGLNPKISFNNGQTLNIVDSNNTINLGIDGTITITGPTNIYQDISNTQVYSSFSVTNTSAVDFNLTFKPLTKLYVLSGITQINSLITFTCMNVINLNNMSGKIMGTTWGLNSSVVNAYDINIWTFPSIDIDGNPSFSVSYNTLAPVNTTNNGDWIINRIYLTNQQYDTNYHLNIECIGSANDRIIWGLKVDIIQI